MDQNGVMRYFECRGARIEVKKETSLCSPKLSDSYVYYIVEGIASLTSLTTDGEEKDFIYFPQGHLLGFTPALMRHYRKLDGKGAAVGLEFGDEDKIPFGIDTKTDCVFYRMPEREFESLLETDARFLAYIMEAVTCNYVRLIWKLHDAQEEGAMQRLCKWFLTFSVFQSSESLDGWDAEKSHGCRAVPRGFTYAEIAKYLGMHPVTVSKLASGLKKAGIIKKNKGRILVMDEKRLRELSKTSARI